MILWKNELSTLRPPNCTLSEGLVKAGECQDGPGDRADCHLELTAGRGTLALEVHSEPLTSVLITHKSIISDTSGEGTTGSVNIATVVVQKRRGGMSSLAR